MSNAPQTFNAYADSYNEARRRLIPPLDSFYAIATEALDLAGSVRRVLDIGAGTGLLSAYVRSVLPDAQLTLLDAAPAMLAQARESLGDHNTRYVEGDLEEPLPQGPWDAVVSALAIHHLGDAGKRDLFARVRAALRPGGVFVNAEQVAGPTPRLSELYGSWHERRARGAGSDDAEWQGALERMSHDRLAGVGDQLTWLRQAGFAEVDCLFKEYRFAVVVAIRR
jgi:tRNA (cmo5U34)-methyltransferase